jgi:hypothetical protein
MNSRRDKAASVPLLIEAALVGLSALEYVSRLVERHPSMRAAFGLQHLVKINSAHHVIDVR